MSVYYGVVKDNMVVLPEGSNLPDGSLVEIRLAGSAATQVSEDDAVESAVTRRLIEAGLLLKPRAPHPRVPIGERRLIQVAGTPLSQAILEERR